MLNILPCRIWRPMITTTRSRAIGIRTPTEAGTRIRTTRFKTAGVRIRNPTGAGIRIKTARFKAGGTRIRIRPPTRLGIRSRTWIRTAERSSQLRMVIRFVLYCFFN